MRSKLGWSKEDHDKEDAMNSPEVRAGFYEVIDLATDEQHGSYATLDEARAAVRYDRLKAYAIWRDNVRVECCDPYDGDDDRMKQAMGNRTNPNARTMAVLLIRWPDTWPKPLVAPRARLQHSTRS